MKIRNLGRLGLVMLLAWCVTCVTCAHTEDPPAPRPAPKTDKGAHRPPGLLAGKDKGTVRRVCELDDDMLSVWVKPHCTVPEGKGLIWATIVHSETNKEPMEQAYPTTRRCPKDSKDWCHQLIGPFPKLNPGKAVELIYERTCEDGTSRKVPGKCKVEADSR